MLKQACFPHSLSASNFRRVLIEVERLSETFRIKLDVNTVLIKRKEFVQEQAGTVSICCVHV